MQPDSAVYVARVLKAFLPICGLPNDPWHCLAICVSYRLSVTECLFDCQSMDFASAVRLIVLIYTPVLSLPLVFRIREAVDVPFYVFILLDLA
jgi:hypothetical protein